MKNHSAAGAVDNVAGEGNKAWNSIGTGGSHVFVRRVMQMIMFLVAFAVLWMFLYNNSASPFGLPATISHYFNGISTQVNFLSLSLKLSLLNCDLQLEFWVLCIILWANQKVDFFWVIDVFCY